MTSSAHPLPESFATIFWSQRKREWPHHYFTPEFQEFWTSHPRDRVFNYRTNGPSPHSASAFYRMHTTLLVIKVIPCPRPCNRNPRITSSIPTAFNDRLCPPIT